jgi:predicted acetyltransferase
MTCAVNETKSVVYRPVEKHEQLQALKLWYIVYEGFSPRCFERDFTDEASPMYQDGDTIGTWYDGQLVSTVHIRRIILQYHDDSIKCLCGGISNVATLEKYRNKGFSRHLLRLAIERMERSNVFDLSMLGTGRHYHYSVLGWEQITVPKIVIIE